MAAANPCPDSNDVMASGWVDELLKNESALLVLEQGMPEVHRALTTGDFAAMDALSRYELVATSLLQRRHGRRTEPTKTLSSQLRHAVGEHDGSIRDGLESYCSDATTHLVDSYLRSESTIDHITKKYRQPGIEKNISPVLIAEFDSCVAQAIGTRDESFVNAIESFNASLRGCLDMPEQGLSDIEAVVESQLRKAKACVDLVFALANSFSTLLLELNRGAIPLVLRLPRDRPRD